MKIFFNSSMPRACSTLLQNILMQNPEVHSTPTDGVAELLWRARTGFTDSPEFRAQDQDLMLKAWRAFCKGGIEAYSKALTDRPYIFLKSRAWKGNIQWLDNFMEEPVKMVIMVRNMKSIIASFEKMYRKNPDRASQWYIPGEMRGTTVEKRVDMYVQNAPLGISIDRIKDLLDMGLANRVCIVRAEDLCQDPQKWMNTIYDYFGMARFGHDFNNVEQLTHENDVIHGLDNDLHTIQPIVEPLQNDYRDVLGVGACQWIDEAYDWYQRAFNYKR